MKRSDFVVGRRVEFSYNGKNRVGLVDRVYVDRVCVKLVGGGFKSFSFDKIRGPLDSSRCPMGWDKVTA